MKIGIDYSRGNVSQKTGTENYSYNITKELISCALQDELILYTKDGIKSDIKNTPKEKEKIINLPRLWTQLGLAAECLVNPPDVLFIPAHTMPVVRWPSLKTVVTIHDLGAEFLPQYHKFPQKLYLNKSTVYAVKNATKIIAVSEATKTDLIKKMHCDIEKITVIPEAYDNQVYKIITDNEKIENVFKKYNLPEQIILFVGTIQPRKNILRALKAFAIAKKEGKIPHTFVLVGKKGWLNEEIYEFPKKEGIEKYVRFLGFVPSEEVSLLLNKAEIFLFPSLFEGFGIPLLEAMACGCPVITSKSSSMPEVVGEAALLINPTDEIEISQVIINLLKNKNKQKELKEKGLKQVQKFSWANSAKKTYELLKTVGQK